MEPRLARRLLKSFGAQGVQLAVRTLQQIGLVPILLTFWAPAQYETWIVLAAMAGLVPLAELGTQAYFGNRLLVAWVEGGAKSLSVAVSLALTTQTLMVAICLALAGVAALLVDFGALAGAPAQTHTDAIVTLALLSLGNLLAMPLSTISAVYRARGDFSRFVNFATLTLVMEVLAVILAAAGGGGMRAAAAGFLLGVTLSWLLLVADLRRHYPDIVWRWKSPTRVELRDMFRVAPLYCVNSAANIVAISAPVFVLKRMALPGAVLAYTIHRLLAGLIRQISFQMAHAMSAEMARQFLHRDTKRLRKLFIVSGTLTSVVYGVVAGLLVSVAHPLVVLWTHGTVPYDPELFAILLAASFFSLPGQVALTFFYYVNQPAPVSVAHGANAVLSIALCIVLAPSYGAAGAALAIGVVEFATLGLGLAHRACRTVEVSAFVFLAASWSSGAAAFAISSLIADALVTRLQPDGARALLMTGLAWTALICAPVAAAALLWRSNMAQRRAGL